jgi:hypothetical protein
MNDDAIVIKAANLAAAPQVLVLAISSTPWMTIFILQSKEFAWIL